MKRIEDYIIAVPDFPKPGIIFQDITGILSDPDGLKLTLDAFLQGPRERRVRCRCRIRSPRIPFRGSDSGAFPQAICSRAQERKAPPRNDWNFIRS